MANPRQMERSMDSRNTRKESHAVTVHSVLQALSTTARFAT